MEPQFYPFITRQRYTFCPRDTLLQLPMGQTNGRAPILVRALWRKIQVCAS